MATLGLPKAAHGLENRERQLAHRHHVSARVDDDVGQLAVIGCHWLSLARRGGRQRTNVNLNGLLRTTPRGFEDRASAIHRRPLTSASIQSQASVIRDCSLTSTAGRQLGCHLGCGSGLGVADAQCLGEEQGVVACPPGPCGVRLNSYGRAFVSQHSGQAVPNTPGCRIAPLTRLSRGCRSDTVGK